MVKGLYTAHTGMVNEMKRLDILANNLANADTTAYKKKERRVVLLPMRCLCALRILLIWGFRKSLEILHMGFTLDRYIRIIPREISR